MPHEAVLDSDGRHRDINQSMFWQVQFAHQDNKLVAFAVCQAYIVLFFPADGRYRLTIVAVGRRNASRIRQNKQFIL
jgi:hypothetical protein